MTPVTSPLTGSTNVRLRRRFLTTDVIEWWMQDLGINVSQELGHTMHIDLYRCLDTDLSFFVPKDLAGGPMLYEQLQHFNWYYMPDKWEHRVALRDLHGVHRALEIGCGRGAFLHQAISAVPDLHGIEINAAAVSAAQQAGLPVRQETMSRVVEEHAGSFQAVLAFQVLEHISNLKEFLTCCVELLEPGGRLVLSVPDDTSRLAKLDAPLNLPPHHMSRWTPTVFTSLPRLLPLRLLRVRREPLASYHVLGYTAALTGWDRPDRGHGLAHLIRRLYRISLALPLYLGVRHLLTGHTLYALLEKTA